MHCMPHPTAYVEQHQHPRGDLGARLSTHETAAKARAARMDPEVHAWAVNQLRDVKRHPEFTARALLDAHRRDKIYVPDPVDGEFIVSSECLLGTCGGIKFDGGDCDDLAAGLGAALTSVGVQAAIVGQRYMVGRQIDHVLVAAWDGNRWWYLDPSNPALDFGAADPSTSELWVDVITGKVICDGACNDVSPPPAPTSSHADFVGVAGTPDQPSCTVVEQGGFNVWSFVAGVAAGAVTGVLVTLLLNGALQWKPTVER